MDKRMMTRCAASVFVWLTCAWMAPAPAGGVAGRGKGGPVEVSSADADAMDLREKLATLVIPELSMDDMPVMEVFEALRRQSKALDPARQGINLLVQCAPGGARQKITVSLSNVALGEAIRYVCMASGLSYRIDPAAVVVMERGRAADLAETRFYLLQGGWIFAGKEKPTPAEMKQFFEDKGVPFPEGTAIAYYPRKGRLAVTNTAENQRKVERVLRELGGLAEGSGGVR